MNSRWTSIVFLDSSSMCPVLQMLLFNGKKHIPGDSKWPFYIFLSPIWRSLNLSKRSINHPKKGTNSQNCERSLWFCSSPWRYVARDVGFWSCCGWSFVGYVLGWTSPHFRCQGSDLVAGQATSRGVALVDVTKVQISWMKVMWEWIASTLPHPFFFLLQGAGALQLFNWIWWTFKSYKSLKNFLWIQSASKLEWIWGRSWLYSHPCLTGLNWIVGTLGWICRNFCGLIPSRRIVLRVFLTFKCWIHTKWPNHPHPNRLSHPHHQWCHLMWHLFAVMFGLLHGD